MWGFSRGTINKEKVVFAVAVAWLCLMGVRFIDAPRVRDWGPPRTFVRPPLVDPHHLEFVYEPGPVDDDSSEDEDNDDNGNSDGGKDTANRDRRKKMKEDRGKARGKKRPAFSDKARETGGQGPGRVDRPPPRYVGTVKIGYGDRWIIFAEERDTRYLSFPVGTDSPRSGRRDSPRP